MPNYRKQLGVNQGVFVRGLTNWWSQ